MPKAKKGIDQEPLNDKRPYVSPIPSSNEKSASDWTGLLTPQGLPMLPFPASYPTNSVDMNLVVALAQIMTMNALSTLGQHQVRQTSPADIQSQQDLESLQKKQSMMLLQQRLKNRKSNPAPPIMKKKRVIRKLKTSPKSSPTESSVQSPYNNISPLELLALATTAQQHVSVNPEKPAIDNPNNHRESFSYLFDSDSIKSPSILSALQNGFPNIDWSKVDNLQSPSQEAIQSMLNNVSETEKQT